MVRTRIIQFATVVIFLIGGALDMGVTSATASTPVAPSVEQTSTTSPQSTANSTTQSPVAPSENASPTGPPTVETSLCYPNNDYCGPQPPSVPAAPNYTSILSSQATYPKAIISGGASISGVVTAASNGAVLGGVCVSALDEGTGAGTSPVTTTATGTYTISGLPAGSYAVHFTDGCGNATDYADQWYNNKPTLNGATLLKLTSTEAKTGVSAKLAIGASISGVVTAASNGADLTGICVMAQNKTNYQYYGDTAVTTSGAYTITGLPAGSYAVHFIDGCGNATDYADQYYNNQYTLETANAVSVTAGGAATAVNASLALGASISGTVTDSATGATVSGVCVTATDTTNFGLFAAASTTSSGTYSILGLDPGSYIVGFQVCNNSSVDLQSQWYNGAPSPSTATPLTLVSGTTDTAIDAALLPGGAISGKITSASTGKSLSGICVYASAMGGSAPTYAFGSSTSTGAYTLEGLAAGSYAVEFYTDCGNKGNYVPQYYNDAPDYQSATAVPVTVGQTTGSINAAMAPGGAITGTVKSAATGKVISHICVDVTSTSNSLIGSSTITSTKGSYKIIGLAAGSYDVMFQGGCGNSGSYQSQYYNNSPTLSGATAVTVTVGLTTSSINAAMAAGGTVSGTVTDSSTGAKLAGICVYAYDATHTYFGDGITSSTGSYKIVNLTPDSYYVEFYSGCSGSSNYLTQWYKNASSQTKATLVPVTAGHTSTGISAKMVLAGGISGTVTDSSGNPIYGICVSVTGSAGSSESATLINGSYTVSNLKAGSYTVEFFTGCGSSGTYADQWYNGSSTLAGATPVSVTAGSTLTGIDAAMLA